jgi:hypothetical protein
MATLTDYQEGMLEHIYYDQKNYFGRDKLFDLIKDNPNRPTRRQVGAWLKNQKTHQLHLRPKRSSAIRPIVLNKPDTLFQMDLIDMGSHKDGVYRYILVLVDAFTRFAFAKALKTKTAEEVFKGFRALYEDYGLDLRTLQTDNGAEFQGKLGEFLQNNDIKHITGIAGRAMSQGIVERLNGTIKNLIFRNMTATGTKKWKADLDQLIDNYNNSLHRSTEERPIEIDNPDVITNVATTLKNKVHKSVVLNDPDDLKAGDNVRIKLFKGILEKSSTKNWTDEIFQIKRVIRSKMPYIRIKYKVIDSSGAILKNSYVRNDLQKTNFVMPLPDPEPEEPNEPAPISQQTPKPKKPKKPNTVANQRSAERTAGSLATNTRKYKFKKISTL